MQVLSHCGDAQMRMHTVCGLRLQGVLGQQGGSPSESRIDCNDLVLMTWFFIHWLRPHDVLLRYTLFGPCGASENCLLPRNWFDIFLATITCLDVWVLRPMALSGWGNVPKWGPVTGLCELLSKKGLKTQGGKWWVLPLGGATDQMILLRFMRAVKSMRAIRMVMLGLKTGLLKSAWSVEKSIHVCYN